MSQHKRITTAEAATLRGVTRGYIYKLYTEGRLKGKLVGRSLTFAEADVRNLKVGTVGRPKKPR